MQEEPGLVVQSSYDPNRPMTETQVTIPSGQITLAGTLLVPEAPRAVVVFVHGSGPLDRDENSKGARLNVFNSLAETLAAAGIASLRYDKRGVGGSGGRFNRISQADLVADLRAVAQYVTAASLGPVFLCGHSEGTVIATQTAAACNPAGLILICPYVMPGPDLLRWQAAQTEALLDNMAGFQGYLARAVSRVLGRPVAATEKMIARVLASNAATVRVGLQRIPARWMRDFLTSDVAALHAGNTRPTLVIGAARDAQCPPKDAQTIASQNPAASLTVLSDLSHLLRHTVHDGMGDYQRQLDAPVDTRVAQAMIAWLDGQLGKNGQKK